jgi:hypothetical protein
MRNTFDAAETKNSVRVRTLHATKPQCLPRMQVLWYKRNTNLITHPAAEVILGPNECAGFKHAVGLHNSTSAQSAQRQTQRSVFWCKYNNSPSFILDREHLLQQTVKEIPNECSPHISRQEIRAPIIGRLPMTFLFFNYSTRVAMGALFQFSWKLRFLKGWIYRVFS